MLPLLLKDFKNCYWKFYRSDELLSEWWYCWFAMIFARCPVSHGVARERSRTPTIIPSRVPSAVVPSGVIPSVSAWHGWTERTWKFCDGWKLKSWRCTSGSEDILPRQENPRNYITYIRYDKRGRQMKGGKGRVDHLFPHIELQKVRQLSNCQNITPQWQLNVRFEPENGGSKETFLPTKPPIWATVFCGFYQKGNCMSVLSQLLVPNRPLSQPPCSALKLRVQDVQDWHFNVSSLMAKSWALLPGVLNLGHEGSNALYNE